MALVDNARAEAISAAAEKIKMWNFMACSDADGLKREIESLQPGGDGGMISTGRETQQSAAGTEEKQ